MKKITITITASSTSLVFQGLREYDYNHHNFIVRPHVFSKLQYVDCGGRQDSDGASYSSSCKEAPTQLKIHVQIHVHCTLYKHTYKSVDKCIDRSVYKLQIQSHFQ